ncbi:unnamed protein product [Rotaria sordida]|uniref:Uncharacterized protein n=1 Tax=Rotaria sordida TaxID=392033 RepID=A0A815U8P0_9BILA|nr:unnamed protein product [Rotaria sordida]CAF1510659.1 unnamed protein product [Rotaria sordida]
MESNLDLIKNFVEWWKERIYTSTLIIYKLISDQDIKSKQKYYRSFINCMKNSYKNIYTTATEDVRMLLNIKKLKNESN